MSALTQKTGVSTGYGNNTKANGVPGLVEDGNLDLVKRQIIDFTNGLQGKGAPATEEAKRTIKPEDFPPGSYGSEYSMTVNDGDKAVIIPSIFDGKLHSEREAFKHYKDTGKHMGKFNLAQEAVNHYKNSDNYSNAIHNRQIKVNGKVYTGRNRVVGD